MLKKGIACLLIILAIYWSFSTLMPSKISTLNTDSNLFSTERALVHLAAISQEPHYVGSEGHAAVRDYIIKELEKLGLETQIQEGYSISKWGNMAKPKNILARIPGSDTSKALMLLSHYDSSPHSSLGASDAGSGVVTILEGIRAYLENGQVPKNDIIICITDSEELGLNGADLFVNKHHWAEDVGLVLNFEARGSGGPSYMLLETNGNDTDLTVFRTDGDIEGFNFAFIDDHFDYHTANDSYDRLDRNTLEHQGSYLMPLLDHFSKANLNNLKSDEDYIYFNTPIFRLVKYPFSWIYPMIFLAVLIFVGLFVYGKRKRVLHYKEVGKGFLALFIALLASGLVSFLLWKFINYLFPEYSEILHGFTYNGHTYIIAFTLLSIGIYFYSYHKFYKPNNSSSLLIAPLFLWLVICVIVAIKLEGASFFIIPVFFGLLSLWVLIRQQKPSLILMALLAFPVLFIMSPLVKMFPVGLGLEILFVSAILVVLIASLLLPVFGFFRHKNRWSYLFFFLAFCFFLSAHFNSDFTEQSPKPNSLVYTLDADTNTAVWATYDNVLDDWTQNFLGDDPDIFNEDKSFASKYRTGFSFTKNAPVKAIAAPTIMIKSDTVIGASRHINMVIKPERPVNRMELFADNTIIFNDFNINGLDTYKKNENSNAFENRWRNRLFSFYVSDSDSLILKFTVPKEQKTKIDLFEASYDLLENNQFTVPKRSDYMIPKPFVLNDAIMVRKTITID